RLEKLTGDRDGEMSIRVNNQYRICFTWLNNDAYDVELIDYH
ncbi:MAG: type II toxin-antitoxin system RelE/ParE family toxin, partial [Dethiobacteria bacterium]|nr:type II toxin-antitoxin system RelE/ParE family toxin [Dethiobacteria bacterium]